MHKKLLLPLLLILPIAACAKSNGTLAAVDDGPAAPINDPDTRVIEPSGGNPIEPGSNETPGGVPGSNNGSTGGASTSTSSPGGPGSPGGNGSQPGNNDPGGNSGSNAGSPVPEPGTLILFGSGIAGLAGFSLRRRRRED